jgi:hypothetical protein
MPESADCATAPCSVYRHSLPRDVGVTLVVARVLLIVLLLGFVCRECLSVRSGFADVAYVRAHVAASHGDPPDLFEYVWWPLGMLALSLALLASSVVRIVLDRRALCALRTSPGATVWGDRVDVLLIRRLGLRTVSVQWSEVTGARVCRNPFGAAHVVLTAVRRRHLRLAPYLEGAGELIAEVQARAGGGRAQ